VTKDDKDIGSVVQQALASRVGEKLVQLWVSDGVSWQLEGPRLTILARCSFRLERLRRYRAEFSAVACELAGPQATVDWKLSETTPSGTAGGTAPVAPIQRQLPGLSSPAPSSASEDGKINHPTPSAFVTESPQVIFHLPSTPARDNNGDAFAPQTKPANKMTRRNFASLDDFVVGEGNRLAHAAVCNLLNQLGRYSPLFIYGPPGCGKTHLLEGVWRQARQTAPSRRTIYLSAEQFTTQFIEALRGFGLPSFRRKYRDVELLLIDDLQFFAGKPSTLVELQHTVDTLLRAGRQIVFAADRPLNELNKLGSELVARIGGGLVCAIDPADTQTRLGILEQLAATHANPTPRTVLEWLSTQLDGDARQLAGALNRLHATSEALNCRIDLAFAQRALADLVRVNRKAVRLTDITNTICDVFGIDEQALQSESKSPAVSHPRMLAMWLARKYTRAALSEIGRHFGRKSHTTVLSAEDKVSQWLVSGKKNLLLPEGDCRLEDVVKRVELQLRLA
jgi:chromosomal replication initiator protein